MALTYGYVIIPSSEKLYKLSNEFNNKYRKGKMTKKYYRFTGLALGIILLVFSFACQAKTSTDLDPQDEGTQEIAVETDQNAEEKEETAAMPEEELAVVVDECLQCHTDQQTLTETADTIVVVESENSGEG